MRVISGTRKGQKLISVDDRSVRPTTDRIKESLFNLVSPYLGADSRVLDLFAGSGALAIEALSRGAKSATLIDKSRSSCDVITNNLAVTKLHDKAELINMDAQTFLATYTNQFDIVFMDPPYNNGLVAECLKKIEQNDVLSKDGIIVVERDNTEDAVILKSFEIVKDRKYGRTYITIYQYNDCVPIIDIE